jgi:hypothetical protein
LGYSKIDGLEEKVMEALRKEAENCDFYQGTFMLHSVGGGTGSGFGSRLIEKFSDEFPSADLISAAIWPHPKGDTPLQSYNSCLTTSHLLQHASSVFLFENDHMLHLLSKHLKLKKEQSLSM